jgi:hypothetical protein
MPLQVQDNELIKSIALPAAGANNATAVMDLGARTSKADRLEEMEIELSLPATATLVNTKAITFAVQTDDDSAFGSPTVIPGGALVVTGAGGNVSAAAAIRFRLATTNLERYIRATATVPADAGDNQAYSYTLKALF